MSTQYSAPGDKFCSPLGEVPWLRRKCRIEQSRRSGQEQPLQCREPQRHLGSAHFLEIKIDKSIKNLNFEEPHHFLLHHLDRRKSWRPGTLLRGESGPSGRWVSAAGCTPGQSTCQLCWSSGRCSRWPRGTRNCPTQGRVSPQHCQIIWDPSNIQPPFVPHCKGK